MEYYVTNPRTVRLEAAESLSLVRFRDRSRDVRQAAYAKLRGMRILRAAGLSLLGLALPSLAAAQHPETLGTRAQGMGGAFVGVADDASAVYWNPAGLARGAYFSLVLDGGTGEALPETIGNAASRSGWLLALSTPALGLTYYRLATKSLNTGGPASDGVLIDSLVTQHVGATLVQSVTDFLAVGSTVKVIRGVAGSAGVAVADREDLLDDTELVGRSSNRVDLDIGVMAAGDFGRIGVVVRNVTEPSFETPSGRELGLNRQVRAGASVLLLQSWKLAADYDFLKDPGPFGDVREFALGTEAQVSRRLAARAGFRINTAGELGRTPSASVGASFAIFGSVLIDGQITGGSDKSFKGWGLAGRFVY